MTFTTPIFLVLLLTLPLLIWVGRPYTAPFNRRNWRVWISLLLRLLIVVLIILALAGAQAVRTIDELAVVFLVDGSDSINAEQFAEAEDFVATAVARMGDNDQAAVVVFGADALVERPLSNLAELAPITSVPQALQTDLAGAIRLGLALFPAGSARRLVVLSDGAVTSGDTRSAAQLAAANGVPLDYIFLQRPAIDTEVTLLDVTAPTRVGAGEIFRLAVTAESSTATPVELRVLSGGNVIHQENVQMRPGINNYDVRLRATTPEFVRYQVQLAPVQDTYFQNNELAAFTEITGAPRLLLVAPESGVDENGTPLPDEAAQLQLALTATNLEIDRLTAGTFPADLTTLSNYAAVVLVNINARDLSPRKMETLQSYVRDLGGGLVVVGGPESYGMGGYFQTPLEAALPVNMQINDQERFPAVSIALVIDRSGSMGEMEGGATKIQLANEGAARVVQLLNDSDEITVIPVDTTPNNPIGPLSAADKDVAIEQIRQIGAGGGGIYVRTGLEAASAALTQSPNPVKHIILLADGSDSEQKEGVPELIEALTAEGVTISTVSIGGGPDTAWLEQMAELGNGRFHFTDQAANLPQIFTQETTAIQRSYLIEERFFPTAGTPSPILSGIRAVPPLYGYVGTSPKDTAQVILATHQGDPLLAAWQYGLGRAVAWTSDATGRWATDWVRWEGFPAFWAQAVRWTLPVDQDGAVETAVTYNNNQAQLTVDVRDGDDQFRNNLQLEANIIAPDGSVTAVTLPQVAPGRYATAFTPRQEGAYLLRLTGEGATEADAIGQTSGWVLGYSPEYRDLDTDPQLLYSIAEISGGQDLSTLGVDAAAMAVFSHDLTAQAATQPIWPWLLLSAVLLLPIDVGLRRLVITRADWRRAWVASFGRWQSTSEAESERPQQMSQLFAAKKRMRQRTKSAIEPIEPVLPEIDDVEERPLASDAPLTRPPTQQTEEGTLASRLLKKKHSD
ncbi:MAG: VWA domain-containing protein [Anaerolineales bacterium]|nr:VWA domain-containing protein [Anaerolineales bacterium]